MLVLRHFLPLSKVSGKETWCDREASLEYTQADIGWINKTGNTKGVSITVQLTSCLTPVSGNHKGGSIVIPLNSCLTSLD